MDPKEQSVTQTGGSQTHLSAIDPNVSQLYADAPG